MSTGQDRFREALFDPDRAEPAGLHDGAGHPARRRFDVYRNNVAHSLSRAMHETFPVVTRLLGARNMHMISGLFVRAHPPGSPLLMDYGAEFPAFLAASARLAHLGYLPDVARLELALRRSYHAADGDPLAPQRLAALTPGALMRATVALAPAVEILRSDWPVLDIWRFNTAADAPRPQPGAQDVVIVRPEFDPVPHPLPPGGAAWIAALAAGQSIGAAYDGALAKAPGFDPGVTLGLLLQGGALISLTTKD